jgi:hypothetical protein
MNDLSNHGVAPQALQAALEANCDALMALEAARAIVAVDHPQAAGLADQAADALRRAIRELRELSRQPASAAALGFVIGEEDEAEEGLVAVRDEEENEVMCHGASQEREETRAAQSQPRRTA